MMDQFFLPDTYGDADIQSFTAPQTVTHTQWVTWRKPRGVSMCQIICIGGGGGGGGGFSTVSGSNRGGGAGGGSSSIATVVMPLYAVPDDMYVQVGAGGIGVGSGGGVAGSGLLSYVSVAPSTVVTPTNVLAVSGTVEAAGGTTGTGGASGVGGAAGTVATIALMPLAGRGQVSFFAGQQGAAGGNRSGGIGLPSALPTTGCPTMGGTGGAGTNSADFAGGIITPIAESLLSQWAAAGAPAGSFSGSGGFLLPKPFFSYCGLGGGAAFAGIGGNGGDGGPGSGGGGGGAGTTGGQGGDGGAGIVIIISW